MLWTHLLVMIVIYAIYKIPEKRKKQPSRFLDCYAAWIACAIYAVSCIFFLKDRMTAGYQRICMTIVALLALAALLCFIWLRLHPDAATAKAALRASRKPIPFGRRDLLVITSLCLLYGAVSFYRLGDHTEIDKTRVVEAVDQKVPYDANPDPRKTPYFDEVFYMRTVFNLRDGERWYENTHPPLGKLLIAAGTAVCGTTAFGFRVAGAVFGILMLPFVYLLARDLTRSHISGTFAASLFAVDFMHFTQTRLATIDVFITFFTIVMFYFMYRYVCLSFYDTPLVQTLVPLGMCGIAFGFGIACKWTGFYSGAGLAALLFGSLSVRYREYRSALQVPDGSSCGISHAYVRKVFWRHTAITLGFCLVFFVVIPGMIYLLSYLPFSDGTDAGLLTRMWNNQRYMLRYHAGLTAEHAYASPWYQWPVMTRPVFYFSRILDGTMRQGISAFGNPLVWWAGILSFFHMIWRCLKDSDRTAGFLAAAYISCYLPWCFVTRCTFLYHYFPCVPFVACMIAYSLAQWRDKMGQKRYVIMLGAYFVLAALLFATFYPVISGCPVSKQYVDQFLRWRDTWVLVQ